MIPVFIGGTGRSGTSILKRLLAHHPHVASIPVELRVIIDPGGALDLKAALCEKWSPYGADCAIHAFRQLMRDARHSSAFHRFILKVSRRLGFSPKRYGTLGLGDWFGGSFYDRRLDALTEALSYAVVRSSWMGSPSFQFPERFYETDQLTASAASKMLAEFFHDLFRQRGQGALKTHWVDDTPLSILHAKELMGLFPEMKLIHIYRDPRDVLASYLSKRWGGKGAASTARRLSGILGVWSEQKLGLPEASYLEVSLESISSAPERMIPDLLAFCGLEPHDLPRNVLDLMSPQRVNAGRWKSDLSREDVEKAMPYLAPYLSMHGYE